MEVIREIYLNNSVNKKRWEQFLQAQGIDNFSAAEVDKLQQTLGLFDKNGRLVGTGSLAGNVIKYVAVCQKGETSSGQRFNRLLTELTQRLLQANIAHYFVFTKPQYVSSFEHIGFHILAQVELGAILEKGFPSIQQFLAQLPKPPTNCRKIAAIVMNANPFTNGHRYLVETASQQNDLVYVFVVQQNSSLFTTTERLQLVKAGVMDLSNVRVVSGDEYMVSYATFPAYFLPSSASIVEYQTQLDAKLFKDWVVPTLRITDRYLGAEPLSPTTEIYNCSLQKILAPEVDVHILARKQNNQQVISASKVRQALQEKDFATIKQLVPATTWAFIERNLAQLEQRIEKGSKVNGN